MQKIGGTIMSENNAKKAYEERQQQIKEILENLEDGVRGVFTSENYIKYLETFSKFHNYSFNNIILILSQFPQASYVASFKDWNQKFNRIIKKGEKGIKILVPTPKKVTVEEEITNPDGTTSKKEVEKKRLYFKLGHVYDLSQTVGDELPSLVKNLELDTPELNRIIFLLMATSQVPIQYDYSLKEDDANGYYNILKKEIYLKPSLQSLHKLKTIVHEYSHYLQETIYAEQTKDFLRDTKEVIAESAAFCVISMLSKEFNMEELDSSQYSFGYIASWGSKDLKELKTTLELISKISNTIFDWISKQFVVA